MGEINETLDTAVSSRNHALFDFFIVLIQSKFVEIEYFSR